MYEIHLHKLLTYVNKMTNTPIEDKSDQRSECLLPIRFDWILKRTDEPFLFVVRRGEICAFVLSYA